MIRYSCLLLLAAVAAPARAERPYTVDDMLALESIGSARFDPSGDILLFERYGPFDEQSDFSRSFVIGELRSKIYRVALGGDQQPQLLFQQDAGEGYTLGSISPDGAYVTYLNVSSEGLRPGVASLDGQDARSFDVSPDYMVHIDRPWMIGSLLPYEQLQAGEVPLSVGLANEELDALVELWHTRNAGTAPTALRIGSGRFSNILTPSNKLVLVDAHDGSKQVVAPGRYAAFFSSADGTLLAALREQRLEIDPDRLLEHGANIGGVQHELLVLDTRGAGQPPVSVCNGCDVLTSSLNWSADAPLLSFYARDTDADWPDAQYRVYDHRTGETRTVQLDRLEPHIVRGGGVAMNARSAWLGEQLAVYASPSRSEAEGEADAPIRADWYLLGQSAPRNLTAAFPGEAPVLVALRDRSLFLLHDGDLWRVDENGERHNLTASVDEELAEWRRPTPYGRLPRYNLQPVESVVLQVASADEGEPDRVLFVDLDSGSIDTVKAPSSRSEFIAASPAAGRAALVDESGNETLLVVADADGSQRVLARLNSHLTDVVGGTPTRIDHDGPDGSERVSWMLLPPGHAEGDRHPTIVNVYPGPGCRETWTRWQLDDMHALNDHLLAAQGYAVLYPCVPVDYHEVPRDPLDGLVEEVFAAVDAAIAGGYADPDRLAIQGQSYGGYTTGALVGLTDRFKTAVAQAGLYDLISAYGQFDIRQRLLHDRRGLFLFGASLLETSQGGMGAPPWEDPERYLRNSPLMHVENVSTPILLFSGDRDYVSTTQTEEFFTALTRLNKDAVFVRYFGEGHVFNSPANIRDMWKRIFEWYAKTLGAPAAD